MSSPALLVYERLTEQVAAVRSAAASASASNNPDGASGCLRSCIVLSVAALDTYMHEQGVRLLRQRASVGQVEAGLVANYLGTVSAADIQGVQAEGLIRLRLSYKTLVSKGKIDELVAACGLDAASIWTQVSIRMASRPDRLQTLLQLQVDRRNQIAHEGDWDPAALDLRGVTESHADDCSSCVDALVRAFDLEVP